LVFGVVLCEDVIAILLMAALITIANAGAVSIRALSIAASLLALFIVVLIAIGLVTVPYIVREVARLKRPETLLILSLGLCFAFAMIAERAGYSLVLGAFLAGSLVAGSGHGAGVEKLIVPIRQVFGAIFFVAVGMLIDPPLLARYWAVLAVLVAVVVVGKIVSVSLASIAIGERPDTALKSGFAMAGVFSILIAEVGSGASDTRSFLYTLAVSQLKRHFEQATGIKVEIELLPVEQVLQKLTLDVASSLGTHDLYYIDQSWAASFGPDVLDPRLPTFPGRRHSQI
jgi:CPA2 family monovalent cation:H+ antiporter-2